MCNNRKRNALVYRELPGNATCHEEQVGWQLMRPDLRGDPLCFQQALFHRVYYGRSLLAADETRQWLADRGME